jgi:2',3'-cyclic-nucleotide 2'-phosphodiesterase (5'-nucleotidase family)
MMRFLSRKSLLGQVLLALLWLCQPTTAQNHANYELTILYTNDFHSAFDPIPAYWLPGEPKLGGASQLAALINQYRQRGGTTFLFDSGDMFTGQLSFLTRGEALMEMMISMHYDAMAIGNHEFDYGSSNFTRQMSLVPFPVLGANIYYKGANLRYARPYTIIERNGVRLGVIGIIGGDAIGVVPAALVSDLEFRDPEPEVAAAVRELRDKVDLIVVLSHQGKTGPQQTDAEAHPDLQRDFDDDIKLCGDVPGIDVFVGGHAHIGIEKPYVHPRTGTIIVQTYGYGTRLGYLKLMVKDKKVIAHKGELVKVWSDQLKPDPVVAKKLAYYKQLVAPQIGEVLGVNKTRLVRDYRAESSLGSFVADVMRERAHADVAIENAGGLRWDIPAGEINKGHVLDALPFLNYLWTFQMTGAQIREVLEHSLSLIHGMAQVSGLRAIYDMRQPVGHRLVELRIGGQLVDDRKLYRVGITNFIAEGGDEYYTLMKSQPIEKGPLLSEIVMDYFRKHREVSPPQLGRLVPLNESDRTVPMIPKSPGLRSLVVKTHYVN